MTDLPPPDPQRAAFEAWCCARWGGDREALRIRDMVGSERLGEYVNGHVQFAWAAWQAGVAAERAKRRSIAEHVANELEALDDETAQLQAKSLREWMK